MIIYGVKESDSETDESAIKLLESIDIEFTPRKTYRLGRREANKIRPIKVVMSNDQEKQRIMAKLKSAAAQHEKIFIRKDYSTEERDQIQKFVEEAKKRNRIDESESKWRVKGCPRKIFRKDASWQEERRESIKEQGYSRP